MPDNCEFLFVADQRRFDQNVECVDLKSLQKAITNPAL